MEISDRYNEDHFHQDGLCVMQYKRTINDKVFLFTYLGTSDRRSYKVTELHPVYPALYQHRHNLKVIEQKVAV